MKLTIETNKDKHLNIFYEFYLNEVLIYEDRYSTTIEEAIINFQYDIVNQCNYWREEFWSQSPNL